MALSSWSNVISNLDEKRAISCDSVSTPSKITLEPPIIITAIAGGSLHDRTLNSVTSDKSMITVVHTTVSQSSLPLVLVLQESSSLASAAICCNARQVVGAATSIYKNMHACDSR